MENDNGAAQPGWYPTPEGGQRYWDGEKWLSLPAPVTAEDGAAAHRSSRRSWAWAAVAAIVLIGLAVGIGYFLVSERNRAQTESEAAASVQAEEEASARAAEEAAEEARQAQEREDEQEREFRQRAVSEIEDSIATMAEGHSSDGIIDGPVLDVVCSPVAGGSLEDLTEQTTVFDCFVATEENENGTWSGHSYHATMNWNTEQFTYGFGAP